MAQTHRHFELIVVDDGSTDDTEAVMAAIGDARTRYVKLKDNVGQAAARNIGIGQSRSELLAFQDSDDVWHPEKLSRQLAVLERSPELAGVYCDLDRCALSGRRAVIRAPDLQKGRDLDDRPSLYQTYGIGIQSCVIRKSVLSSMGGFREDLRCFEDLELLLRIARRYSMERIPEALVEYYESETSVSKNAMAERQARMFLLMHHGLRNFLKRPIDVSSEAIRCATGVPYPRKAATGLLRRIKRRLTGTSRVDAGPGPKKG